MAQGAGADVLAIMPGVINRPDNKSLRFAMLKYGLESFCPGCSSAARRSSWPTINRAWVGSILNAATRVFWTRMRIEAFSSSSRLGYAWTNITQRIGFDASGVVDYDPDFLLDDSTMYVYFAPSTSRPQLPTWADRKCATNLAMVLMPGDFAKSSDSKVVAPS